MAYKIHFVEKLCCGSTAYTVELDKSIKKIHVPELIKAGYLVPEHYSKLGLFYCQKNGVIATCSFDRTMINIRCGNNPKCEENIKEFAELADALTTK